MPLSGKAFIALWNDRSAERADYDIWHTREHVPERLTVPGVSRAVRYSGGIGALPRYFTLYTLDDLAVLSHPDYIWLLHHPTDWSRSMRPDMRRFLRLPCAVVSSTGGGVGGWCVACLVNGEPEQVDLTGLVEGLMACPSVTSVHYGTYAAEVGAVPFAVDAEETRAPTGVLVVEGFEDVALRERTAAILKDFNPRVATSDLTSYELAFMLDAASVEDVRPCRQSDISRLLA